MLETFESENSLTFSVSMKTWGMPKVDFTALGMSAPTPRTGMHLPLKASCYQGSPKAPHTAEEPGCRQRAIPASCWGALSACTRNSHAQIRPLRVLSVYLPVREHCLVTSYRHREEGKKKKKEGQINIQNKDTVRKLHCSHGSGFAQRRS